jgi:hypothetical protein
MINAARLLSSWLGQGAMLIKSIYVPVPWLNCVTTSDSLAP